ncbi:MAG TPA: response regulator transcription factor [Methylomirabilota bacterium]|nr:response regulator transcription factor [Methylomirabilota bacterium]
MTRQPPDAMTPARLPKILLVDDHPAVLRQTISLLPQNYEIVETLESGFGLKAAVSQHEPDLIVLDITLPGLSGIELASRLRQSGYLTKIVFLTVHCDTDYAREAFAAGANGYVVKARLASDLVPALQAVLAGQRFISPCAELEGWDDAEP